MGSPVAWAWLRITPDARSSAVTTCVAVQTMLCPGARVVGGHPVSTALGSAIATLTSVTFPVFVAETVYTIDSPAFVKPVADVDLTSDRPALRVAGTDTVALREVTTVASGATAVTVAMLTTAPRSRSACVTTCVAAHVDDAPTASVAGAQATRVATGSVMVTLVRSRVPLLVAVST